MKKKFKYWWYRNVRFRKSKFNLFLTYKGFEYGEAMINPIELTKTNKREVIVYLGKEYWIQESKLKEHVTIKI